MIARFQNGNKIYQLSENIPNGINTKCPKLFQMAIKIIQKFSFGGPPKYTQIGNLRPVS
jgi:hypothetical protein